MKKTVSAVLVTKNEEHNIRRVLDSLNWVDEIIVVDSGSVDNTLKICREYEVRIEEVEWKGFTETKNIAMELADSDWILSLDADEEITPELKEELLALIESDDPLDGYRIPRKNHYLGKWIKYCGWYPDLQMRLWKYGKGRWMGGRVHESVFVDGSTGVTKAAMNHFSYNSIADHLERINKYSGLNARDKYESGKRCSFLNLLFVAPMQFVKVYLIRGGFLDGSRGLIVSVLGAFYAFQKKARLWELQQKISDK